MKTNMSKCSKPGILDEGKNKPVRSLYFVDNKLRPIAIF
jgi:hypothetical protein